VVKTSHFGSNRSYGLSKAILLYSDGQEAFATVHEPKKTRRMEEHLILMPANPSPLTS
jgi:hypothetical protein